MFEASRRLVRGIHGIQGLLKPVLNNYEPGIPYWNLINDFSHARQVWFMLIRLLTVFLLLIPPIYGTTYYVQPGGSGISDNPTSKGGLQDTWNDIGVGIGDGDIIELASGTYSVENGDFPATGLGAVSTSGIDLTIRGETAAAKDVVIDGNDLNTSVELIAVSVDEDTWTFTGITFCNSSSIHGEVHVTDGTFNFKNCEFYNNGSTRGSNGICVRNNEHASRCYAYNCVFHDLALDGISMKSNRSRGMSGSPEDRIVEAYMCSFYNLFGGNGTPQGISLHTWLCISQAGYLYEGSTARAYLCKFRNIRTTQGPGYGSAIAHDDGKNQNIYAYGCTVIDCDGGFASTGEIGVYNCYVNCTGNNAAGCVAGPAMNDATIEDSMLINNGTVVYVTKGGITLRRCLVHNRTDSLGYLITGATPSDANGRTLTVEDSMLVISDANSADSLLARGAFETVNFNRNFAYANIAHPFGMIRIEKNNPVTINCAYNDIYCGTDAQLCWATDGDLMYNGRCNNYKLTGIGFQEPASFDATDVTGVSTFDSITWQCLWDRLNPYNIEIIAGDINGDNTVNCVDLSILCDNWLKNK